MLLGARQFFQNTKKLPYDAEVEYLESTGTQYINTGVAPTATQKYEFRGKYGYTTGNYTLIASYKRGTNSPFYLPSFVNVNLTGFGVQTGGGSSYATFGTKDTNVHNFIVDFPSRKFILDSSEYQIPVVAESYNDNPYFLFAANSNGTGLDRKTSGRIYYMKIYDNGVLVRDYIPVRKNGVGYLYDRVSRRLFGNDGTGVFSYGDDILPVRVGTEGAMKDVVTGEIYRNSGSGAFLYGPDKS